MAFPQVRIGRSSIGDGHPVYVVAEIGINHNGDLSLAEQLIDVAAEAGCDAVKFQKRIPSIAVPVEQQGIPRETPWGVMSYLEYKERIELDVHQYQEIDERCKQRGIDWFVSCWDEASVDAMEAFDLPCYKIASASLTDDALLARLRATGRPLILSTGMSTFDQIKHAVSLLDRDRLILTHCTSAYPCAPEELNLRMINTLKAEFACPVGYSGHESGLSTTSASVALGASLIERHITLDRAMWGTDQAASVEPQGLRRLVRDIRVVESALGTGVKQVYDSELPIIQKLRRN